MANLPGTMPQIFSFTVRNDSIAESTREERRETGVRVI